MRDKSRRKNNKKGDIKIKVKIMGNNKETIQIQRDYVWMPWVTDKVSLQTVREWKESVLTLTLFPLSLSLSPSPSVP